MYSSMKTVGALKRAKHNRSCVARGSLMPGVWYPFRYWRTSANESMSIDFSSVWKTLAAVAPLMGRYKLRVGMYYCPRRLYHRDPARNARKFDIRTLKPWLLGDVAGTHPDCNQFVEPGSLFDWLGLPTYSYGYASQQGDNAVIPDFNIEPLLCYLDIWRNYLSSSTWEPIPAMVYRNGSNVGGVHRVSALRYQDLSLTTLDSVFEQVLDHSSSSQNRLASDLIRAFYDNPLKSTAITYNDSLWDLLCRAGSGFMPARVSSDRISRLAGTQLSPDVIVSVSERYADPDKNEVGGFSITSAALAADLKRYYDTTLASGSRYSEWLNGHYDVQIRDIDRPLELDMFSFDVTFSDVVSVSEAPDAQNQQQTLGGMASLSRGTGNSGRKSRRYFSPEDGYLMCMVALVPEVSYLEGVQPELLQTSATDTFIPEFNGLGMQTFDPRIAFAGQFNGNKLRSTGFENGFGGLDPDKYDLDGTILDPVQLEFDPNAIYGYEPPFMDYTSSLDTLHGDFAGDLSYWSLVRSFIGAGSDVALGQSAITDLPKFMGLAPYAIPWQYLSQFTNTIVTSTPFQIQIGFSFISRSLVSKHQSLTL